MHNYKLGDLVRYPVDRAPFEVVGIRKDKIEIEGDFSGGTHNVTQRDWVPVGEIELFNPKQASEAKVKFYEYGQSLGIKINDLQRLMVLAKSSDVELEPIVPPTIISKEELKEKYEHGLTVGGLKKALEKCNLPDDGKVMIQRIEDRYYNGNDISGFRGCDDTEDGIYPPGSRTSGWGVYLKEGESYHSSISFNKKMREEVARRERGEEPEYDKMEDPLKFMCPEDEKTLNELKEQYTPAWCVVGYKDEEHLFIDLHY